MRKIITLSALLAVLLTSGSCSKVEGPGGSSSITGKLNAVLHDGFWNETAEYDLAKEDVYIIYGDENTTYDDDVETSYDGTFKFEYLEPGTYQVFVYDKVAPSELVNYPSGKKVKILTVEITEKKSTVDLGTIDVDK